MVFDRNLSTCRIFLPVFLPQYLEVLLILFLCFQCPIEGYYDDENHVIYLHVTSAYDTATFSDFCHQLISQPTKGVIIVKSLSCYLDGWWTLSYITIICPLARTLSSLMNSSRPAVGGYIGALVYALDCQLCMISSGYRIAYLPTATHSA